MNLKWLWTASLRPVEAVLQVWTLAIVFGVVARGEANFHFLDLLVVLEHLIHLLHVGLQGVITDLRFWTYRPLDFLECFDFLTAHEDHSLFG